LAQRTDAARFASAASGFAKSGGEEQTPPQSIKDSAQHPSRQGSVRSQLHHGFTVGGGTGVIGVLLLPELATTTPVTVPATAAAAATTSIVFCVLKNPVGDWTLA